MAVIATAIAAVAKFTAKSGATIPTNADAAARIGTS